MTDLQENSRYGHVFRPGPFRQVRACWIDGHQLRWRVGAKAGHLPLQQVVRVELGLPPPGKATARCSVETADGETFLICDEYWASFSRGERHRWGLRQHRRASFLGFVGALIRRVRRANPQVVLIGGEGLGRADETRQAP